jgi:hypothetical protein
MKTSTLLPPRRRSLGAVAILGIAFSASVVLAGCSGGDQPSNLGNTGDHLQLEPPTTAAVTLEDFNGHWIGEAEDPLALTLDGDPGVYRFPSGSSAIRLDIVQGQQGTISFGDPTPPPPPTNFDVGYPEGVNYMSEALFEATALPPVEGFVYRVDALYGTFNFPVDSLTDEVPLKDGVVRLSYRQNDLFDEWCQAQVPSGDLAGNNEICLPTPEGTNGGYGFGADTESDPPICHIADGTSIDSPGVEVDCNQAYLCGISRTPICTCGGDQCFSDSSQRPSLYLRQVGDELVGTFGSSAFYAESGQLTSLGTVRFRRAE